MRISGPHLVGLGVPAHGRFIHPALAGVLAERHVGPEGVLEAVTGQATAPATGLPRGPTPAVPAPPGRALPWSRTAGHRRLVARKAPASSRYPPLGHQSLQDGDQEGLGGCRAPGPPRSAGERILRFPAGYGAGRGLRASCVVRSSEWRDPGPLGGSRNRWSAQADRSWSRTRPWRRRRDGEPATGLVVAHDGVYGRGCRC